MEYIEIDKKIFLQQFRNTDFEAFSKVCAQTRQGNYMAIEIIWNSGIEVYLIYKRFWFRNVNVGFVSMIDCKKLRFKERKVLDKFGMSIPKGYNGIFINDMRVSIPNRYKGIGTKVVNKILRRDVSYMLEPVEDGNFFWKKFGFEMDDSEKFAYRNGMS